MRGSRDAFAFPARSSARSSAGKPAGALVLHGFSGSPFEVRYLGEKLSERGFEVLGPALAGHAHGDPDELDTTRWSDWQATAEAALDELRSRCSRVAVVGLSMGGLLSLRLAATRGPAELAAIVPMAVPLWLPGYQQHAIAQVNRGLDRLAALPLVGAAARHMPHLPKAGGLSDVADPAMRKLNPSMPAMPLRALGSLVELMTKVRAELPSIRVPALCVHALHDHTAPYACLNHLAGELGSPDVRLLTLANSWHVVPIDRDRDRLALAVGDFLEEKLR